VAIPGSHLLRGNLEQQSVMSLGRVDMVDYGCRYRVARMPVQFLRQKPGGNRL
jgi:hypothetical protein